MHTIQKPGFIAVIKFIFLFTIMIMAAQKSFPQEFKAKKADIPIKIDGVLDDEAWKNADTISDFTQFEPVYNAPSTYTTTVKVLYDDRMIYFSFDCKDPEPDKITAKITKRDDDLPKDDGVVVFLDTFHDRNSAYFFAVNPIGTQSDGRFADNGRTADVNWDTSWLSASRINDDGWTAEFGIPFEVLKFNSKDTIWGFNAERRVARSLERSFWVGNLTAMFRISQFGILTGLDLSSLSVKRYTIIPYSQFQFQKSEKPEKKFGVDLRYNLLSNLGIEATVNPDFATIETDEELVNLTRFELFYPEKRPFFLEGAENYSTRVQQFYSKRIGEIPWGVKLTGKISKFKINALTTRSDPSSAGADVSEGDDAVFSVFRINRETSRGSNIGLIGANRTYLDKNSGSLGLVSTLFFTDVLGMTSQVIKSWGDEDKGTWAYFFRPAYDSQFTHFHVRYSHFGEGVMENINGIGFIRDDDRREFDTELEKKIWINKYGIESIFPGTNYNRYWSQDGILRSWESRNKITVTFLKKWEYSLNWTEEMIRFEKDFRNRQITGELEYDNKLGKSVSAGYTTGRNYDRDLEKVTGEVKVKFLEGWDVTYYFSRHWFRPAKIDDNSWIHYVRSTYYVNKDLYFKLFYQTKYRVEHGYPDPEFDLMRKYFQLVFVWRILPPFGSLQLAYQEDDTRSIIDEGQLKTLFCKLSWVL